MGVCMEKETKNANWEKEGNWAKKSEKKVSGSWAKKIRGGKRERSGPTPLDLPKS